MLDFGLLSLSWAAYYLFDWHLNLIICKHGVGAIKMRGKARVGLGVATIAAAVTTTVTKNQFYLLIDSMRMLVVVARAIRGRVGARVVARADVVMVLMTMARAL